MPNKISQSHGGQPLLMGLTADGSTGVGSGKFMLGSGVGCRPLPVSPPPVSTIQMSFLGGAAAAYDELTGANRLTRAAGRKEFLLPVE